MNTRSTSRALLAAVILVPVACAQIFGVDEDYRLGAGGSSSSAGTSGSAATTTTSSSSNTSSGTTSTGSSSTSSSSSGSAPCTNVGPVTIATVDSSTGAATGTATQRHVFWSPSTKLWWFFYIDGSSPSSLQVANSPDFMTWSTTAPLGMPSTSTSHGSSFSVDVYSPAGGTDVAEIAIGLEGMTYPTQLYHFRARLLGPITATFDTPYASIYSDGTGQANYNDHVSIAASDNGYLAIASGLFPSGGDTWTVLLTTSGETDKQSWVPTWVTPNVSTANTLSRQVVSLGGGTFMTLADDVSTGPPQTVSYAVGTMSSSSWTPGAVPFGMLNQDTNGWSAAVSVSGQNVVVVRYQKQTGGYDFAEYSGGSWTVTPDTPSNSNTPVLASGVLTAIDGSTPAAVIIDSATHDIVIASSHNGWTWTNNIGGGSAVTRQSLSGYNVAVNHQTAVTWTETSAGPSVLKGALICVP